MKLAGIKKLAGDFARISGWLKISGRFCMRLAGGLAILQTLITRVSHGNRSCANPFE